MSKGVHAQVHGEEKRECYIDLQYDSGNIFLRMHTAKRDSSLVPRIAVPKKDTKTDKKTRFHKRPFPS